MDGQGHAKTWFKMFLFVSCIPDSMSKMFPWACVFVLATFSMTFVGFGRPIKQLSRATKTLEILDSGKKCPNLFQHFQCPGNGIDTGSRQFVGNLNWHIDLSA